MEFSTLLFSTTIRGKKEKIISILSSCQDEADATAQLKVTLGQSRSSLANCLLRRMSVHNFQGLGRALSTLAHLACLSSVNIIYTQKASKPNTPFKKDSKSTCSSNLLLLEISQPSLSYQQGDTGFAGRKYRRCFSCEGVFSRDCLHASVVMQKHG